MSVMTIRTGAWRSEALSSARGDRVGTASLERTMQAVSQAIMSADATDTLSFCPPCSQHGIEQIARAAQSGMTKNAPTNKSTPIPPTSFLLIEGLSCMHVWSITLGYKVDRRRIPIGDDRH